MTTFPYMQIFSVRSLKVKNGKLSKCKGVAVAWGIPPYRTVSLSQFSMDLNFPFFVPLFYFHMSKPHLRIICGSLFFFLLSLTLRNYLDPIRNA